MENLNKKHINEAHAHVESTAKNATIPVLVPVPNENGNSLIMCFSLIVWLVAVTTHHKSLIHKSSHVECAFLI